MVKIREKVLLPNRIVCILKMFYSFPLILICFRSNPPPPLPHNRLSQRRCSLNTKDNFDKPADSSIHGNTGTASLSSYTRKLLLLLTADSPLNYNLLSLFAALDGVPFSLHPKFDIQANGTVRLTILK